MDVNNLKVGDRVRIDYSKVNDPLVPYSFPRHMANHLRFHERQKGYLTINSVDKSFGRGTVYTLDVPPNDNGAYHHQIYIVSYYIIKEVFPTITNSDIYEEAGKRV